MVTADETRLLHEMKRWLVTVDMTDQARDNLLWYVRKAIEELQELSRGG